MKDWSFDPRLLGALALFGLGIVVGLAIGGGSDRTVIVSTPAPPAAPPSAPTGTSTTTSTSPRVFRQPRSGEGVSRVTGGVKDVRLPSAAGGAGGQGGQPYTLFVIRPDTGPSLRAGFPGDARTDPNFPQALLDPNCELKVRARFTVAPVL